MNPLFLFYWCYMPILLFAPVPPKEPKPCPKK